MIVQLAADGSATLVEPDVFTALSIEGVAPANDAARQAIEQQGIALDDDLGHGWLAPATLLSLAGNVDDDWRTNLNAMATYAMSKGWTDDTGRLRAHTTWSP